MSKHMLSMPVAAVLAAGAAVLSATASSTASAMPLAGALSPAETAGGVLPVWWYREWGSGYGPAYEVDPYYYRSYPRYRYYTDYEIPRRRAYDYDRDYDRRYYDDDYYDYAYERYPSPRYRSAAAAYCANRYRSWDPESGTFMGYDGLPHRCP